MPKPKFSWSEVNNALTLKVTDGIKETTWIIRKATKIEDVQTALEEMVGTISIHYQTAKTWDKDYDPYPDSFKLWRETVRTVDEEELEQIQTEAESRKALADKAAKAQAGAWFSNADNDVDDLPFMVPNQKDDE